jgi:hypothetical protein
MRKIILILAITVTTLSFGQRKIPSGGTLNQYLRVKDAINLEWATLTPYTAGRGIKINSYVVRIDSSVQVDWTNGLKFGGTWSINSIGNTYFNNGLAATKFSSPKLEFYGNSTMTSPTDGNITLAYQSGSDFDRLQFGGTTSSYPSLQRKGVKLVAKLADNSGNTHQQVKDTVYSSAWNGRIDVPTMNAVYDKVETLVKYTDTATMLTKYLRSADTLKLRQAVNLRVKYTDTATMLSKYVRKADTAAMLSPYVLESKVYSGTYSPSASDLQNVTSVSFTNCGTRYMRINNQVTVTGAATVAITSSTTLTSFELTLPIASTLTTGTYTDISGVVTGVDSGLGGTVTAENNHAQITWSATGLVSGTYNINYTYSYTIN